MFIPPVNSSSASAIFLYSFTFIFLQYIFSLRDFVSFSAQEFKKSSCGYSFFYYLAARVYQPPPHPSRCHVPPSPKRKVVRRGCVADHPNPQGNFFGAQAPQITLTLKGILLNNKRYSYPTVIRTVCEGAPARREGRSGTPSRLPPRKDSVLTYPAKGRGGILPSFGIQPFLRTR